MLTEQHFRIDDLCFHLFVAWAHSKGAITPLKPVIVTLFNMIFKNSENNIRDRNHFVVHYFATTVLCSILHLYYSSKPVMRLYYQISLKSPPNLTG